LLQRPVAGRTAFSHEAGWLAQVGLTRLVC